MKRLLATIAASLLCGSAFATTIDFEDVAVPNGANNIVYYPTGVTSNGFSFSNSHHLHLVNNDYWASYNGTTWLGLDTDSNEDGPARSYDYTLQAVDGSAFSLNQLDISEFSTLDSGPIMHVTIQGNGGSNPSLYFTTDGITYDDETPEIASFETIQFGAEWSNLNSVTFSLYGDNLVALDNIVVSTVPVPAAVWLFGSGLALLGSMRQRRSQSVTRT